MAEKKSRPSEPPPAPDAAEMYRQAVELAPNAIVMTDRTGRIVLVNEQTERLFGYDRQELLGRPVEILVPQNLRARHEGARRGYSAKPEGRAMGAGRDLFGVRKDGAEIPVEIGLNPIHTGSEVFVLAAIVDITERRELQRKLAQSEALAAVGSMAAVMAHEIRNPLGSIVMAARSLSRGDLSQSDRETVSAILGQESQRLNRTLQDFLQFARPRQPRRAPTDLNQQVEEIIRVLSADKELARKVRIEASLDKNLPPLSYDADQVGQVLWNLMLNGIQAMDGEGKLKVSTKAANGEASVSVVDSGPGIPAEALARIFDPFFTTKQKGTGLGLAIAQRIIEAHGGRISVANEPRGGARFSLALPLAPR